MKIRGVLETCIYAGDLEKAELFYSRLPGLKLISKEKDRHLFFRCGKTMLLIFNPEHTSREPTSVNGSAVPLHGAKGPGHIAFSVNSREIGLWKSHLKKNGIDIESEVRWPNDTVSIYFRDPDGNSLELTSPDLWDGTEPENPE